MKRMKLRSIISVLLVLVMTLSLAPAALAATSSGRELNQAWTQDQSVRITNPAPSNLNQLKQAVDTTDPRAVAAYWVLSIWRLAENYNDGMQMMKYLYADLEIGGSGYYEGGLSGKAGWDTFFNDRLDNSRYEWLPRAYFEGSTARNGFTPPTPLSVSLGYEANNTTNANDATSQAVGRLSIVYSVESNVGSNKVYLRLTRFAGSDRWYVTNGGPSSTTFFVDLWDYLSASEQAAVQNRSGGSGTTTGSDPKPILDPPYNPGSIYGQTGNHTHEFVIVSGFRQCWEECTICGEKRNELGHEPYDAFNSEEHWLACARCEMVLYGARPHEFVNGVCEVCGCRENEDHTHIFEYMADQRQHWEECLICGQTRNQKAHVVVYEFGSRDHWPVCTYCGEELGAVEPHSFVNGVCTVCGAEPVFWSTLFEWKSDDFYCWQVRKDTGEESNYGSHTFEFNWDKDNHWTECTRCERVGYTQEHTFVNGKCAICGVLEAELNANPFVDVNKNDYYYDAVQWAYHANVTSGTSETTFAPDALCTRAQVVTFLWRAAGCPHPVHAANPFSDVKASDWYYMAVLWAVEEGITAGTSATTFTPGETCSSAHIATFLYRFCGGSNGWYQEARAWALSAGFAEGTGLVIDPGEPCPRGAVVTFLHRNALNAAG